MFRELNRIRKEYRACDGERHELRMQLVMLRGELGLAQCQLAEMLSNQLRKQCESISNVSAISANGITSSTLTERKKIKSVSHFSFDDFPTLLHATYNIVKIFQHVKFYCKK